MFIEKSVIFRTSAVYHSHILGIKTFGDNGFNHPAGAVSYTHLAVYKRQVVARGMGECCVSGCGDIAMDEENKKFTLAGIEFHEGDLDVYKRQGQPTSERITS